MHSTASALCQSNWLCKRGYTSNINIMSTKQKKNREKHMINFVTHIIPFNIKTVLSSFKVWSNSLWWDFTLFFFAKPKLALSIMQSYEPVCSICSICLLKVCCNYRKALKNNSTKPDIAPEACYWQLEQSLQFLKLRKLVK